MQPTVAANLHHLIRDAIIRKTPIISLPPGTHHIHGALLPERFCHVTNNDHGLKRILLDVNGAHDLTIDGNGATLVIHGEIIPIAIKNSATVTVKNLTIDWHRPAFTQATVTASGAGFLEFRTDLKRYPLRVSAHRLIAEDGEGWKSESLWNLLPFDKNGEIPAKHENWHLINFHKASVKGDIFRLEAAFAETHPEGTTIALMHGNRVAPAVWIEDSEHITVQDITIHHAMGMGVVAQLSKNVTVERVTIAPSGDRLFSTWVDAVHMCDCSGATRVIDCRLRGQFDDAINLHASFSKVIPHGAPNRAILQLVHPQRYGDSPAKIGLDVAFYRRADLGRVLVTRVTDAARINQESTGITVADALPTDQGDLVCGVFDPSGTVEIRGNFFGPNRGRGILINLEHHVTIANNHFHVSGRAIESQPDANYWWEGSPVRDLTIRDNHLDDCGYGPCGDDAIFIGPELPDGADPRNGPLRETHSESAAHAAENTAVGSAIGAVTITGNRITHHRGRFLHAHGIANLTVTGNRLDHSGRYPQQARGIAIDLGPGIGAANVTAPDGWA